MDAGKYYAILRFEQASLCLRAALHLGIVDKLADGRCSMQDFQAEFGLTVQATRTFVPMLEVLEILQRSGHTLRVAERARVCLAEESPTSRRPYLALGMGADVAGFCEMLRGKLPDGSLPLYGGDATPQTVMDIPDAGKEIAFGLASRARNFAEPLAAAMRKHGARASILADIGAGSPYVVHACLQAMPYLRKAVLVDRPNGMQYAKQMAEEAEIDLGKIELCEKDFFQSVPPADFVCISNTAHDWLLEAYDTIIKNVDESLAPSGVICIHEPMLSSTWASAEDWVHALWMASYAVALFRITEGKGTCYTREEHDQVLRQRGFVPIADGVPTADGCTAIFYQRESEATSAEHGTDVRPEPM